MAKKPNQAAASSGYWENLRRQRRREQEQRGQIIQEGYKNLALGRVAGAAGLPMDIAELITPPLVTPPASLKAKSMRPFPAGMTRGEMPPKDGKGLEYKYTSADLGRRMGISPAEQIAGDVMGPGAPVSAVTKGAAAAVKGLNLSDLAAASSALVTGIFAGKRARNLPKLSYDRALEGEKAGLSKYQIYEETGFWKGPEGEWRFEIDDKDIKFKQDAMKSFQDVWQYETPSALRELTEVKYAPITDAVDHPELFEAYPELKEYYIKVDPEPGGFYRGYQQGKGEKVPLPGGFEETRPIIMLQAPTRESEIDRLEKLLEGKKGYLSNKMEELQMLEGRRDGPAGSEEYQKMVELITSEEKAIAGIEKQVQSLRDGAQPDPTFSIKSTLVHELQHAVQDIENFPRGGNIESSVMQTQRAIEQLAEQTGKSMTEIKQAVASRNYTLAKVAALDKILYLRFLQRYKNSDNPTGSARLIENSSMNYGLTQAEERWLGPKPKRYKRKEYGDYLRRKAELFQAKVIDDILKREESGEGYYNAFQDALNTVLKYEDKRGKVDVSQLSVRNYDPRFIGNAKFYEGRQLGLENNERLANPDEIIQPNWMAIPENVLKNAIKRLSKEADQYVGEQTVLRKVEDATKELEKLKRDNPFDYQNELYYRLAGEAEARAVQERYRLTQVEDPSGDLERIPLGQGGRFDYGAYDRDPEQLAFYYPRDQVPSVPAAAAINVPKSDVGFTSPALRVIMESNREQLPKEQWLKFLKGNGVKDDELEFSGLGEWLKQQKGQVSRADLEEYMTTQNQLKIEEVVYGGNRLDKDVLIADYVKQMEPQYNIVRVGDDPDNWVDIIASPSDLDNYVIVDPYNEPMYGMGGDVMRYGDKDDARNELQYILEESAKNMDADELKEILGVTDESADFFGPVKYGGEDLSLPGQRDEYRELVLYWDKPKKAELPRGFKIIKLPDDAPNFPGEYVAVDKDNIQIYADPDRNKVVKATNELFGGEDTESIWMGSHNYTDKPNPLLHIRFSERRDSAGERILVIEEIQSDIAKRGQKEGFRPKGFVETNEKIETLKQELSENSRRIKELREMSANEKKQTGITQIQFNDLIGRGTDLSNQIETEQLAMIELPPGTKKSREKRPGAPEMFLVQTPQKYENRDLFYGMTAQEAENNAKYFIKSVQEKGLDRGPFIMDTKDYMELGLKRMILWASENGFEKIAWTTGEQQMKRYNQLVEGIQQLSVQRKTGQYSIDKESDTFRVLGTGSNNENFDSGDITRKQLDDYLGERTAEKVVKDMDAVENPQIDISISGQSYEYLEVPVDDLKLPKDPKHFLMIAYDKVLKNAAQKLGKKYDAKVGVGEIKTETKKDMVGNYDEITEPIWTLDISEKLKSAAEKGLPYMAVVPPAAMMMNQEQDRTPINRAAARPIMENYAN